MVVQNKNASYNKNKMLLIMLSVLTVAIVAVLAFFFVIKPRNSSHKTKAETTNDGGRIIYAPATDQEKAASDTHKDEIVKNQDAINSQSSNKVKTVIPVITRADTSSAAGYVHGVFEDGGNCKFTFTDGKTTFSKTSTGAQNATNTSCIITGLSPSDFASSINWTVTLTYSSPKASGISQPLSFRTQ